MEKQLIAHTEGMAVVPHNGQLPGSLELAFLGDTLYDLYVRSRVLSIGGKVKHLHTAAAGFVNAGAQSAAFERIEDMLTEEEQDVVRRARNAKQNPPKNADPRAYHRATAFEALLGYLYLFGRVGRIDELMRAALAITD